MVPTTVPELCHFFAVLSHETRFSRNTPALHCMAWPSVALLMSELFDGCQILAGLLLGYELAAAKTLKSYRLRRAAGCDLSCALSEWHLQSKFTPVLKDRDKQFNSPTSVLLLLPISGVRVTVCHVFLSRTFAG